jgi:hypothetical protein
MAICLIKGETIAPGRSALLKAETDSQPSLLQTALDSFEGASSANKVTAELTII